MAKTFTKISEDSIPKKGQYAGLVEIEGDRYVPSVRADMHERVRQFVVRDEDVYIVTYSKAGTHWMTEIVKSILADGDYEKAEKMFGIHPKPLEYFDTMIELEKIPRDQQRLIVTHIHEELLPKAVFNGKAKIVYVVRNPKDSVVSYFHFAQPFRYSEEFETWETFLQCFMSENMPGRSWFNFNSNYWKHRNKNNFYLTTYEDMRLNIRSIIEEIAAFLGKPTTKETLDKLVNIAAFSRMNKKFDGKLPKNSVPDKVREAIPFKILRKGQVGDWKNQFTVAQNEAFDKLYEEKMKGSSLKDRIKFEI
ncbi:sulfotransferase 1B1-like isoform X1 [Antedon mediterranea]|uniref:sulfotransferase 1B1-like isoform X1 n=1 Tax=Antedon mediterranea TaxID=105859 RepID=UPI003AF4D025